MSSISLVTVSAKVSGSLARRGGRTAGTAASAVKPVEDARHRVEVDRDDHIGAELSCERHRRGVCERAVDEPSALRAHRVKITGMALDARAASMTEPLVMWISSPVARSVATAPYFAPSVSMSRS
ncbi:MAG: hypothetical protein R3C58_10430 [Parvularculaceae bacterium]